MLTSFKGIVSCKFNLQYTARIWTFGWSVKSISSHNFSSITNWVNYVHRHWWLNIHSFSVHLQMADTAGGSGLALIYICSKQSVPQEVFVFSICNRLNEFKLLMVHFIVNCCAFWEWEWTQSFLTQSFKSNMVWFWRLKRGDFCFLFWF